MAGNTVEDALNALQRGDYATAHAIMHALGRVAMTEALHYRIHGLAALGLQDWKESARIFGEAVQRFPDRSDFWFNLATAQMELKDNTAAIKSFETGLQLKPDYGPASGHLANLYLAAQRVEHAEISARAALLTHPNRAVALNILGSILTARGSYTEAEKVLEEARTLAPQQGAILYNLANAYADQGKFEQAWPFYDKARSVSGDLTIARGEADARIAAGDFQKGWELLEARFGQLAPHVLPPCPRYNGEPLAGKKILIVSEQGYGDTLQFCRFGKLLSDAGAELIWMVQKPLVALLQASLPGTVLENTAPIPAADFYIPLMSLPVATKSFSPESWPSAPYLIAPASPPLPPGTEKKIGLVWEGSPTYKNRRRRDIALKELAPLLETPNTFYAAFKGDGLNDIGELPIQRLDHLMTDFAATAALLKQMDVVVTVDTAVAHLAGALGVKTLLLLPAPCEWRWGWNTSHAQKWYGSVQALQQEKPNDWKSVIEKAKAAL